jgi:hypothetical protein
MTPWLLFYPGFNITRIFYYLTMKCGYERCISNFLTMDEELKFCLILLYTTPWVYMFLGFYLYEILPQQFGVRKHPLFIFKDCFKTKKFRSVRSNSDADCMDSEAPMSTDDELQYEIKRVKEVSSERENYPLVVDNLTKVTLCFI